MATPKQRFVNRPRPKEAPARALEYKHVVQPVPQVRGLMVPILGYLAGTFDIVQKKIWSDAGFGLPRRLPDLKDYRTCLDPTVIPLADPLASASVGAAPTFGPELLQPRPADEPGRFLSVADYQARYRSGALTPLHVAEALLPLVRRDGPHPSEYAIAWIQTDADAVLAAARASAARWARGEPLSAVDGVPFGVKDDLDVRGFVSTCGMRVDTSLSYFNEPAATTTWPAAKLIEAGAVMMGKMNMHELGLDVCGNNPNTGTPTNWANPAYYPGGSSSGAGSAVGGGIVPIALGTDSMGSVRMPSSFNGVYGLKTSHSRTGVLALGSYPGTNCIVGPIAGTAADLAIAYRLVSQSDPDDSVQGLFAPSAVPPAPSPSKIPIGICREWLARAEPAVLSDFDKVVDYLTTKLGTYEAVDIRLPYLVEGQTATAAMCLADAADAARARVPESEGPRPSRSWMSVLSYPNRILMGGVQTPAGDYMRYGQVRAALMAHLAALFDRHPGLLVLTPTSAVAGWPRLAGEDRWGFADSNVTLHATTFTWLANMSGCPAVSCPMGYADPAQGDGRLPLGLMATAEWGAEEALLAFARTVEAYLRDEYPGGRVKGEGWVDVLARAEAEKDKQNGRGGGTGRDE